MHYYALHVHVLLIYTVLLLSNNALYSATEIATIDATSSIKATDTLPKNASQKKNISINFVDENLVNIINFLSSKKGVNITLPRGDNAIKSTLTLHMDEKISLDEAWDLLHTILAIAGFSLVPSPTGYIIVKESNAISREPFPIYIGVKPETLPETDQYIRYLYYLANIKVSSEDTNSELNEILKGLLPPNAIFRIDTATNAVLLVAKSIDVKAVMNIITQLDRVHFQEQMEMIRLRYAKAKTVEMLFNENILKASNPMNRYHLDTKKTEPSYFSKYTSLIAEERTNSLIIVGRPQAISRIKNFIYEYIDVDQESGKSILHIYQLQYLNADQFEPVLRRIVESSKPGGSEQARIGAAPVGGPERFFDEVIIKVDKPTEAEKLKYYGGNKLVIAARNDDWKRIKELIEQLDTPQPQVLIEVLIADLTLDDNRLLSTLVRNPLKIPLPGQINFQSAQQDVVGVLPNTFVNPATIGVIDNATPNPVSSDLLRNAFDANCAKTDAGIHSAATCGIFPGATVVSLNDNTGSTWGVAQLLQLFNNTKIVSHPHVIATHNKTAEILIGETRLVPDDASGSLGGTTVRKNIQYSANLKINITPRISSLEMVNLQVDIDINQFLPGSSNAQVTRKLSTNANVNSKDILSLGGLIKTSLMTNASKTPLIGDVPILGWFFKKRQGEMIKTNLTVFISPTIIAPRLRRGIGEYTQDYISVANSYANGDANFDSLKDPITRWFFKTTGGETSAIIDNFLAKDELKNNANKEIPVQNESADKDISEVAPEQSVALFDKKKSAQQIKERIQKEENPFIVAKRAKDHPQC